MLYIVLMNEHRQPSVLLPRVFEHIDHRGTLFEDFAEQKTVLEDDPVTDEIDEIAQEKFHYPLTIEQQEARIKHNLAQRAIGSLADRDSPYGELGGHLPDTLQDQIDANFDLLIDNFRPWMRDIRLAFDRYGLNEITTEGIAAMSNVDRRVLSLHIEGFLERVGVASRLIKWADGDVRFYSQLQEWYGGDRNQAEMIDYASLLETLTTTLASSGVSQALQQAALSVSPSQKKRQAIRRKDDKSHGHPQVVFDGIVPSIERLPHHD